MAAETTLLTSTDNQDHVHNNTALPTPSWRKLRLRNKKNENAGFASLSPTKSRSSLGSTVFVRAAPSNDENKSSTGPTLTISQILTRAGKRGLGGGLPGAVAGFVQVLSMMWLRTIVNYQYRYGTSFQQAVRTLFHEGGIRRFYRGLSFALLQAPLTRFVSTAVNDGIETLMASFEATAQWGPGRTTFVASIVVGLWRMLLMPIDTCKTVLQVDSVEGFKNLMRKVQAGKIGVLYEGAFANAVTAILAHYPWFFTYNLLSRNFLLRQLVSSKLLRNAVVGFVSSIISDTMTNGIRVVKTTKQSMASKHSVSYWESISIILAADGWKGLFGRGLKTRIMSNALQSVIFTIVWRGLAERWNKDEKKKQESKPNEAEETSG